MYQKRNHLRMTAGILACVMALCLCLAGCSEEAVGIASAKINSDGELVLTYTDGSKDNLGRVVGEDGADGQDGKDGADGQDGEDGSDGNAVSSMASAVSQGLRSAVSVYSVFTQRSGWGQGSEYYSAGSGVIYQLDKENGSALILTNYHVVYDSNSSTSNGISDDITVYLYGSEISGSEIPATYVGGSLNYDIAVLYVENSDVLKQSDAIAATIGDSNEVAVGTNAIAIGNPEGSGISATAGVISVDSEYITMTAADGVTSVSFRVMRVDTPVNSGNSGGGLFDDQGRLIGIVNAKIMDSDVENIGYAIPSALAIAVADNIIDYCFDTDCESVQRALLGITVQTVGSKAVYDPETGCTHVEETVQVYEVDESGLGAELEPGDILLYANLNGRTMELTRQYHVIDLLLTARVGDDLKLTVLRGEEKLTFQISITEECLTSY